MNKAELCKNVRSYIIHARRIIECSKSPQYKTMAYMNAVMRTHDLQVMCSNPGNWGMRDVCQMTLLHERHLRALLPVPANMSYVSSNVKLCEIIAACNEYLALQVSINKEFVFHDYKVSGS